MGTQREALGIEASGEHTTALADLGVRGSAGLGILHQPGGPSVNAPLNPLPSGFAANLKLALEGVQYLYRQYVAKGGNHPFDTWFGQVAEQAWEAGVPAPGGQQPPPPPPIPNEPGVKSEGLGPLPWLIWGWEVSAAESVADLGKGVISGLLEWTKESALDALGEPIDYSSNATPGDGSYGDNPGGSADGKDGKDGKDGSDDDDDDDDDDDYEGDGGGGGDGEQGCFVAGTAVHSDDGRLIPIEGVALSDKLASWEERADLASPGLVTKLFRVDSEQIATVHFVGDAVQCTPRHRFYTDHGWVPALRLRAGTCVRSVDGQSRVVTGVDVTDRVVPVFNLRVDGTHTYYVGRSGYLVHNAKNVGDGGDFGDDPDGGGIGD